MLRSYPGSLRPTHIIRPHTSDHFWCPEPLRPHALRCVSAALSAPAARGSRHGRAPKTHLPGRSQRRHRALRRPPRPRPDRPHRRPRLPCRHHRRRRFREEHPAPPDRRPRRTRQRRLVDNNAVRLHAIPRKAAEAAFGHGAFKLRGRDHGARGRIRNAKERVQRLTREPVPPPRRPSA